MPRGVYNRKKAKFNKGMFQKGHKGYKTFLGKQFTESHKQKLKEHHKGLTGKHHSLATRKRLSKTKRKERNPMWRGGITLIRKQIYNSLEYKIWRKKIFEKDRYTCHECYKIGGRLCSHHIKSQAIILAENKIKTF